MLKILKAKILVQNQLVENLPEAYLLTPLHFAISLHFYEIVKELLKIDGTSDNTLCAILDIFPAKHVLELAHASFSSVCLPAEDHIIFRAWKRRGLRPRKATLPELREMGLPSSDTTLH